MKYDYIFGGVGLASLLVLNEMIDSGLVVGKKILLLDTSYKTKNDRTWCFWEDEIGEWDFIVSKRWKRALFINNENEINCLGKNQYYKMIESLSFYDFVINKLNSYSKITWKKETVVSYIEYPNEVVVNTSNSNYSTSIYFNSIFDLSEIRNSPKNPLLTQHFVGWFIKTQNPCFDSDSATFMDFTVPQNGNTRFMYVLPLSSTIALVEYTLFSKELLNDFEYEKGIKDYLLEKSIANFEIINKEKGIIPMTAFPFWKKNSKLVLNIGTAGGWTKASTGFTFKNSAKQAKKVISILNKEDIDFSNFYKKNRYHFYDKIIIEVLFNDNSKGYDIFSNLFTKVEAEIVLKFLMEKTTVLEDLKVIFSCPKLPFIKALFKK